MRFIVAACKFVIVMVGTLFGTGYFLWLLLDLLWPGPARAVGPLLPFAALATGLILQRRTWKPVALYAALSVLCFVGSALIVQRFALFRQ